MQQTFVNVPVPEEFAVKVMRYVAELSEGKEKGEDVPREWTSDLIERAYLESSEPLRKILQRLASTPDMWVHSPEVREAVGMKDFRQLAGTLGAFRKRCKNRYGLDWPIHFRWDHEHGHATYLMSVDVAAVIHTAGRDIGRQ